MRNILIIGSCAREQSIIKHLYNESMDVTLYCMGTNHNPGIKKMVKQFSLYTDNTAVLHYSQTHAINLVIIGPEKYLADGLVDLLEDNGISCIGPRKEHARIETDKQYARNLMPQAVNPKYKLFNSLSSHEDIATYIDFIRELDYSYVIKPTGLCSGKGVQVSGLHFTNDTEGLKYASEQIKAGQAILIEEKIIGDEFTLMSYTDGEHLSHMPLVRDYKLLNEGDSGPNTGSMGCITYNDHGMPFLSLEDIDHAQHLNEMVIELLASQSKHIYRGVIYGSYIKCHKTGAIKLIEFNCRYGDPECVNVLELLETRLIDIYDSIINKTLDKCAITYKPLAVISKYLVPNHYPDAKISEPFYDIDLEWYNQHEAHILCSSMNNYQSTQSRTLVYTDSGNLLETLRQSINMALEPLAVNFKFRRDIGAIHNMTYANCGVDITKSMEIVSHMGTHIEATLNDNVIHERGDFSGIIRIPKGYNDPVLIASIDGVGSKSSFLSKLLGSSAYINSGKDIVGHSINDILVKGAKPFFMLDYVACDKLKEENLVNIVKGMSEVCAKYDCPILGGETAEMPKIYNQDEIDIVGSIVGIAERHRLINGKRDISVDDIIIGLPSNGLHTNGFSMIRKLYKNIPIDADMVKWLSQPHKCYYDEVQLLNDNGVKYNALVHITGGGLLDNPPRVLSENKKIILERKSFTTVDDHYFKNIQKLGNISDEEMYRTFNCGIGFMIVMNEPNYHLLKQVFTNNNIPFHMIGCVIERANPQDPAVIIT
jgi:phosphoribosylaminoimidazole synthetase/phosphoribosylamine--glycine ligase